MSEPSKSSVSTTQPSRIGQPWKDDEVLKILISIQKKKTDKEIALEHGRTIGGIRSYKRKLAADYWFHGKKTMEEIQKFTGLSQSEIQDAITRRKMEESSKEEEELLVTKNVLDIMNDDILNIVEHEQSSPKNVIEIKDDNNCEQNTMNTHSLSYYHKSKDPWTEEDVEKIKKYYADEALDIIDLANLCMRTPGCVAYKLCKEGVISYYLLARGYDDYKNSTLYAEIITSSKDKKASRQAAKQEKLEKQTLKYENTPKIVHTVEQLSEVSSLKKDVEDMKKNIQMILNIVKTLCENK
jgi:hypothetical protein